MNKSQRAARLIFLAFGMGISSWAPMIPYAKERLSLGDAELGLILLAGGVGSLGTMPLYSWLIHRYGSRCITLYTVLLTSAILPMLTVASTPLSLAVVLFLFGAFTGALNVSINAQAVAIEKQGSASIMSGLHCLFSTGGLLGALIVSVLLELQCALPFCASVVAFLMIALLSFQVRHLLPTSAEENHANTAPKSAWSVPQLGVVLLGLCCFISFMAEGSMLDWSAEYLHSSRGYVPAVSGIGYALFSIAMALGRLVGDRLINRYDVYTVFQGGALLAVSGLAMLIYPLLNYAELCGFFLIGLGASNIVPILFSASGRMSATSPALALTIVTTFGYIGLLIGPAFIGFLAEATSLSSAFGCIALFLLAVGATGRLTIPAPSFKTT